MPEIKFAAWNINGAALNAQDETRTIDSRIKRMLDNRPDLDFIFFQEIPNPFRLKAFPSEWISCREDPETSVGKSGILLYKNSCKDFTVKQEVLSRDNPIGAKYRISNKDLELCFIGFWNIPETGGYFTHLNALLEEIFSNPDPSAEKPDEKPTVYIIAGDTNVNMDSQNGFCQNTPGKCANRRKTFAGPLDKQAEGDWLLKKYGLTLLNVPGVFTHKKKNKDLVSYFQCDLLMSSSPENIKVYSLGSSGKDISGEFEKWNSDHLPLFFSFSYDIG